MKRRDAIGLLAGAEADWPPVAHGQAERMRRVDGLINGLIGDPIQQSFAAAFRRVLRSLGWRPGQNVELDYRWTQDNSEAARTAAGELVAAKPDVIFAITTRALTVARAATHTIPIVFASVSDPVAQGFLGASLITAR